MASPFNGKDDLTKSNMKPLTKIEELKTRQAEAKVKGMQLKFANKQAQAKSRRFEAIKAQGTKSLKRFGQSFQQRGPSKQEIQARRMALQARLRRMQAQRMAVQRQGLQDNKWNRMLAEQQMKNEEFNRRREFDDVPDDFLVRRAQQRDAQLEFERERKKKFILHNNRIQTPKHNIDFLKTNPDCNLVNTPKIWREDNPDNNIFADRGRPTLLEARNVFEQTEEQRSRNILNTPHLNFGHVDLTRRPRRRYIDPSEYEL